MSPNVVVALFAGGLVMVSAGGAAMRAAARRPSPRRAEQLARVLRLPLTAEVAERVAVRLRRRTVATLVTVAAAGAPALMMWMILLLPDGAHPAMVPPPVIAVWLFVAAWVAGHWYDSTRTHTGKGPRVARLTVSAVVDVVPPALIWLVRLAGLLPAAAALCWLAAPPGTDPVIWPHRASALWFTVVAVSAPFAVAATEYLQQRLLGGPQRAASGLELAYDDALRAEATLALGVLPVGYAAMAAQLIADPLIYGRATSFGVFAAVSFGPFLLFAAIACLAASPWARRHFRPASDPSRPTPAIVGR
jgi:hypothetical protein